MITFIFVFGIAMLTLYAYSSYRKQQELEERNKRREKLKKEEEEAFETEYYALVELCRKLIDMNNLPWRLYESVITEDDMAWFNHSERTFRLPWEMARWMKDGGLDGSGKECYCVTLDDTFHGKHVMLYFRRTRLNKVKKRWKIADTCMSTMTI